MGLLHKMLELVYPVLRIKNKIFKKHKQGRLRVFLYHDIQPDEVELFAKQIKWLSKHWKFITPQDFESMLSGDMPIEQDSLLLTFDDGFFSNRTVAEEVLDPLGIKAIFFVVSEFADLTDKESSYRFIVNNIFPDLHINDVPAHWYNLKWDELESMHYSGHTIGSHTATHARLSELTETSRLNDEVVNSANMLEERLGFKIKHFAYTFGDLDSISRDALAVASERFDFVYSGLRGFNTSTTSSYAIRRDSVTPRDSLSLIGAFLEGGADSRYRKSREVLDDWVRNLPE